MARLGAGDVVVVTKLDRLGRSTRELLDLIDRISKAGASFRSLGDPLWDTGSSQGRLLSTMLAAIAEFERELIRERTGEGRKREPGGGAGATAAGEEPRGTVATGAEGKPQGAVPGAERISRRKACDRCRSMSRKSWRQSGAASGSTAGSCRTIASLEHHATTKFYAVHGAAIAERAHRVSPSNGRIGCIDYRGSWSRASDRYCINNGTR
jgi:DNA invertase Pin-like site-specific DNA recombinase